jgi:predicted nucleic acid-binding protein
MQSKKVYIASDMFVAFIDRAHPKHVHATAFFRYFALEHYQLYTSIVTVNDSYHIFNTTISPALAKDFLRAMSLTSINILYHEPADVKTAYKTILGSNSAELTFSKALMAVMCDRRSIPQIGTFDYIHSLFGLTVFYLPV